MSFAHDQGSLHVVNLVLAFALASLIGLERELRGKSAGLRTQAVVGTTSALVMLVSKYGFADVLSPGRVVLDPSRMAAQVVSGIGFLGAGLILTHRGSVRGLTTAAVVWETAAIGLAAGAGLAVLAVVVTGLHFVAVFALTALVDRWHTRRPQVVEVRVRYLAAHGALRQLISGLSAAGWVVSALDDTQEGRPQPGGPTSCARWSSQRSRTTRDRLPTSWLTSSTYQGWWA